MAFPAGTRFYSEIACRRKSPGSTESTHCSNKRAPRQDFAYIKHADCFRTIMPLNNSGSKQIMVSMDPDRFFDTFITIGRPGWSGIRLTVDAWEALVQSTNQINSFFKGGYNQDNFKQFINLSPTEKIEFRSQWGKPVIQLSTSVDGGAIMTLADVTWEGLVKLTKYINFIIFDHKEIRSETLDILEKFAEVVYQRLPANESLLAHKANILEVKHNIIQSLTFSDLNIKKIATFKFHPRVAFFELQSFCARQIAEFPLSHLSDD
jgi:hypothetical protein